MAVAGVGLAQREDIAAFGETGPMYVERRSGEIGPT